MKRARHKARIIALQGLYQLDIQNMPGNSEYVGMLQPLIDEAQINNEAAEYARKLTRGTWTECQRFDQMIASVSDHWEVSRMAVVDRNILRLALHELIAYPDVPPRVVIDEAIEIGREFGTAETPQFINGVLDAIWKQHPVFKAVRAASKTSNAEE